MKMWNLITQRAFNKSSHNTNNDLSKNNMTSNKNIILLIMQINIKITLHKAQFVIL